MLADGTLAAFGLFLVRTSALVLSAPVLGQGTGFAGHRVGLIFFLSLLLFMATGTPAADAPPIELALMGMREALIGIFLGYLLQLMLLAVHVAGELVWLDEIDQAEARKSPRADQLLTHRFRAGHQHGRLVQREQLTDGVVSRHRDDRVCARVAQ